MNEDQLFLIVKKWLKEEITSSIYICENCGFTDGHRLIYCPKCPTELTHLKNVSDWDMIKYDDLKNFFSISLRGRRMHHMMSLEKKYEIEISSDEWAKIIKRIKEDFSK
jgi:hypothetical protein